MEKGKYYTKYIKSSMTSKVDQQSYWGKARLSKKSEGEKIM